HQEIVGIGGMNAPFLMRSNEVENDLRLAVATRAQHPRDGARVDRRPIDGETLAEVAEPTVILIELLASGQRPPRYEFMHIGVAGRVTEMLALDARPGRR